MMLSKLYSNALMASLNSRSGVYERSLPSSSHDATYGNTVQFTSVGIAVTTDDSGSTNGTAVQDAISVRHANCHANQDEEKLIISRSKEREELAKTGRPCEGTALSNRSAFYYARAVG